MEYNIGIDLGGTSIKIGIVDETQHIIAKTSIKTLVPRDAESMCIDIDIAINQLIESVNITHNEIHSVGICVPGIISHGIIEFANNLQFKNVPFAKILESVINKPVFLQNDANVATYGELIAGCGKNYNSMCAVIIGTGVGGGIVIDGNIIEGFNGFAAEMGHMIIEPKGRDCCCGKKGCLEAYASMTALIADTKSKMLANKNSILWEICNGDIDIVDGEVIFEAYHKNDSVAKEAVFEMLEYLSLWISNVINLLQPEIVCIGGGISAQKDTIIKPIIEMVDKNIFYSTEKTQIKIAELGNDAGIIGSANLYKNYSLC